LRCLPIKAFYEINNQKLSKGDEGGGTKGKKKKGKKRERKAERYRPLLRRNWENEK